MNRLSLIVGVAVVPLIVSGALADPSVRFTVSAASSVSTRRPFFRSRPGTLLWVFTLGVGVLTFALPYLPIAPLLGFTPLPVWVLAALAGLTAVYVLFAEITKKLFYRRLTW